MKIIFRACDVVNSLHISMDHAKSVRPFGLPKKDIIKIAAMSLEEATRDIDREFYLIGDRVSNESWDFLNNLFKPKFEFNSSEKLGDGGSLMQCSKKAMEFDDDDLIYFAEDDYLHNPLTFKPKLEAFLDYAKTNIEIPWFIHPTDYPDQYTRLLSRCYIIQTKLGYWREVSSTTHTFLTYRKNYKLFVDFFRECHAEDGNDGKLSTIFGSKAMCFSPLPGIATHMHAGTYSNYVDWESLIKNFQEKSIAKNE